MTDAIDYHVTVDIAVDSPGVPREGFGTSLIVSHSALWAERVRTYAKTSDVAADFATTSPEYRMARALFAQTPRPPTVKIGRATPATVTLQYSVKALAALNATLYSLNVSGQGFDDDTATYTSDAGATLSEIHGGLVTDLNAVVGKNYTASFAPLVVVDFTFTAANATEIFTKVAHTLQTGDGPVQVSNSGGALPAGLAAVTDYWVIRLTADTFQLATSLANALAGTNLLITTDGTGTQTLDIVAGTLRPSDPILVTGNANANWFALGVPEAQLARLQVSMVHAAGTLDVELQAILDEDDAWYCLLTAFNSKGYVLEAAAWVEGVARIYMVDVPEGDTINTIVAGSTDTLGSLFTLGYARTLPSFHNQPGQFFSAAWAGRWLSTDPGKASPKFKTLNGISTVKLTTTQRTNLTNRRGNSYELAAARGITFEGTVPSVVYAFIDVTRNRDWLQDQLKKALFEVEIGADIIPFTASGIAQFHGCINGVLNGIATTQGVIDGSREPGTVGAISVSAPVITDVLGADKLIRKLRNLTFSATLQGAIHSVEVRGSISQ